MQKSPRRLRKPLPPAYPLAERFLDVDAMIEAGDPDAEVWLPGETWAELLKAAQEEQQQIERAPAGRWNEAAMPGELRDLSAALQRATQRESEAEMQAARDARRADANAAELSLLRTGLAEAVGWGPLNGAEDLLQVVRGYVMALDAGDGVHRPIVTEFSKEPPTVEAWKDTGKMRLLLASGDGCVLTLDQGFDLGTAINKACGAALQSQAAKRPAKKGARGQLEVGPAQAPGAEEPKACGHCGDTDHLEALCGLAPSEPIEDEDEDDRPTIVETANKQLMEESGRLLNGAGWKRHAKAARETGSTESCHHCGGETDDQALCVRNALDLPNGVFCPGCVLRLRANPREWDRHTASTGKPPKRKRAAFRPVPGEEGVERGLDKPATQAEFSQS